MISAITLSFSDVFADEEQVTKSDDTKLLAAVGLLSVIAIFVGIIAMMADKTDPLLEAQQKDTKIRNKVSELLDEDRPSQAELSKLKDAREGMVYIPAGAMLTGNLHQEIEMGLVSAFDKKASIKKLKKAFYIDKYEYPNVAERSDGSSISPVTGVTYAQARAACKARGKRLCTALEWEKACRGNESLIYSYGDSFERGACTLDDSYQLGKDRNCVNRMGIFGMSGGSREWTKTISETNEKRRIVKGGDSFGSSASDKYRCGYEADENPQYSDGNTSFRCCLNIDAPELPDTPIPELQEPEPAQEPVEDTGTPEENAAPTCSESVATTIEENKQFAIDCYDAKTKSGRKIEGKVSLKVILEEGKVKDVSKFVNEVNSGSFPNCLIKGVKQLEFSTECNEEVTIPFTFPPEDSEDLEDSE